MNLFSVNSNIVYPRSQHANHQIHSQRDFCHMSSEEKNSSLYHSIAIFTHVFNTCQVDLGQFKKL